MGNTHYPSPEQQPESKHAIDALIGHIEANPGILLVTLGLMTSIAMAISKAPHIVQYVDRCVAMGGAAFSVGNITPAADFNIWCDPEAAQICFRSGLPGGVRA